MDTFVSKLAVRFPELTFEPGEAFLWSPTTRRVQYREAENATDMWSLLHETSHGLLGHSRAIRPTASYTRDAVAAIALGDDGTFGRLRFWIRVSAKLDLLSHSSESPSWG